MFLLVTNQNEQQVALNLAHIQEIAPAANHDYTEITYTNGKYIIVMDDPDEVIQALEEKGILI